MSLNTQGGVCMCADVCPRARNETCSADECTESCIDGACQKFLVRFDRSIPDSFERCWIEDMHAFLQNTPELNNSQGLPVDPELFIPLLKEYQKTTNAVVKFQEHIGLFGDELKFIQFKLDSTYRPPTSHTKTEPVLNEWEAFMEKMNEEALVTGDGAENVSKGFQTGRYALADACSAHGIYSAKENNIHIEYMRCNTQTRHTCIRCVLGSQIAREWKALIVSIWQCYDPFKDKTTYCIIVPAPFRTPIQKTAMTWDPLNIA